MKTLRISLIVISLLVGVSCEKTPDIDISDNDWDFEYEGNPMPDSEIQITFFEKIDNEWMISFNAIVTKPCPKRELLFASRLSRNISASNCNIV